MEGILPGTFHETIKEMYEINGLPPVNFPAYIPPPNVDPENVNEEIRKIRESIEARKRAQKAGQQENTERHETQDRIETIQAKKETDITRA